MINFMKKKAKQRKQKREKQRDPRADELDRLMNDFCPLIYKCREPNEWRCFGKYRSCTVYEKYCRDYTRK